MRYFKPFLVILLLPLAGLWWFGSNVLITEWLLGHSEGFQRFVIWLISTLQSSGYVTIILLGVGYVLISLIEMLLWPTGTLTRRWGVSALIFWLALIGIEAIGIFNGYSIRYTGMLAIDGMPPPEWGRWLSGIPVALLCAFAPEGLMRWALLQVWAWWRQWFVRLAVVEKG